MNVLVNAIGATNRITEPVSKSILAYRSKIGLILIVLSALCVPLAFFPQLVADTGSAAFALLWFVLFIPILSKVFGLRIFAALMGLRKEIGILMGTLAVVHSMNYFVSPYAAYPWQSGFWIWENSVTFL